jgi:hypothetical protein
VEGWRVGSEFGGGRGKDWMDGIKTEDEIEISDGKA